MECFVIVISSWKSLTIITKHFILDVVAALDPTLHSSFLSLLSTFLICSSRTFSCYCLSRNFCVIIAQFLSHSVVVEQIVFSLKVEIETRKVLLTFADTLFFFHWKDSLTAFMPSLFGMFVFGGSISNLNRHSSGIFFTLSNLLRKSFVSLTYEGISLNIGWSW